jgi:cytochrome c-type biogenesis protein CcmH/NrfG
MEQMTTDIAVLERALIVMAVCLVIQTLLFIAAGVGTLVAWRRASEALVEAKAAAEAQVAELRAHLIRISGTVDEAARALRRGTTAVDDVMTDVRDAMGTVRNSVGSVASVVTAPRAALALGLWRGVQMWRKRRAARRPEATNSQMQAALSKGDGDGKVE